MTNDLTKADVLDPIEASKLYYEILDAE